MNKYSDIHRRTQGFVTPSFSTPHLPKRKLQALSAFQTVRNHAITDNK